MSAGEDADDDDEEESAVRSAFTCRNASNHACASCCGVCLGFLADPDAAEDDDGASLSGLEQ